MRVEKDKIKSMVRKGNVENDLIVAGLFESLQNSPSNKSCLRQNLLVPLT